jgi:hypothetical protein
MACAVRRGARASSFDADQSASAVDAHLAIDRDAPITGASGRRRWRRRGFWGLSMCRWREAIADQPLDRDQRRAGDRGAGPRRRFSNRRAKTLDAAKARVADNAAPFHDIVLNAQTFAAAGRNAERIDFILRGLDLTLGGGDKEAKPALYDLTIPPPEVDLS